MITKFNSKLLKGVFTLKLDTSAIHLLIVKRKSLRKIIISPNSIFHQNTISFSFFFDTEAGTQNDNNCDFTIKFVNTQVSNFSLFHVLYFI